jgi:hypothetical protein
MLETEILGNKHALLQFCFALEAPRVIYLKKCLKFLVPLDLKKHPALAIQKLFENFSYFYTFGQPDVPPNVYFSPVYWQ